MRSSLDSRVVTLTEGALCQSVTLAQLLKTGKAGGRGDHCRLCQLTYKEVSANGLVSVSDMLLSLIVSACLLFIHKGCHEKVFPV